MTQRVEVAVDVGAVPEQILAALPSTTWTEPSPLATDDQLTITASTVESKLVLTATYDAPVPYFGWVFDAPNRATVKKTLREVAIRLTGGDAPTEQKRPWHAPPDDMSRPQIRVIATISLLLALVEYGNSLLTQTVDYVAKAYDATNAQLGVVTAITRVGNLIVLVGGILADRLGRRRLLLVASAIVLFATVASALAPSLATFGIFQVLVNGATNLAFMVGVIACVEEAPEGSRTYTIAIVGIAAGLGFVVSALLLPLADVHPQAWRGMFALAGLGLLFFPSISRNLKETHRFEALVARNAPRGRISEVVDRQYGGRFALLCITGFLLNVFFAPQAQFTNRFLSDERGFSGFGILVLRAATQAIPAFVAAYVGGRLAESRGRRSTARDGLLVGAIATAGFFLVGGPALWLLLAIGTTGQAISGPALSAFSSELFPTEVRGTAGAGLTITGVMGSATGLLVAGYLAAPFGSIGTAVAVTGVAPLIVAIFLIRHLPEARGRLLDDVSPSEV